MLVAKNEVAKRSGYLRVFSNNSNVGLGGSHKVALNIAKAENFEWLLVFHGDDQGTLNDFKKIIESPQFTKYDAVLGARFTKKSKRIGYSIFRTFGNYVFNGFYSIFLGRRVTDMGSGLNLYKVSKMSQCTKNAPDGLIFPPYLLVSLVLNKFKTHFEPIGWKETDQVSNAKLIKQSFDTFKLGFLGFILRKKFLDKNFSNSDYDYKSELAAE